MKTSYDDAFIPLRSLEGDVVRAIDLKLPAEALEIEEKELKITGDILVKGSIYMVDEQIILNFSLQAHYVLPCKVCNEEVVSQLNLEKISHYESIEEVSGEKYDLREPIREALLVELPDYVECHGGKCPERVFVQKYLRTERKEDENSSMSYHPFSSL